MASSAILRDDARDDALFQGKTTSGILKAAMGIHHSRKMPIFPKETFPDWARKKQLHVKKAQNPKRKIA